MQKLTVEIYKDKAGEFRSRIKRKGRIIFDSGEGYKRKHSALRAVQSVIGEVEFGASRLVDMTRA
jgi:uncharacterized protein YegP (UPF0339 family)